MATHDSLIGIEQAGDNKTVDSIEQICLDGNGEEGSRSEEAELGGLHTLTIGQTARCKAQAFPTEGGSGPHTRAH